MNLKTSNIILGLFVLISVCVSYSEAKNCTGVPDGGIFEVACKSFVRCTGGKPVIVTCDPGMVYNNGTGNCDTETNVPPPCGSRGDKDCTGIKDGGYADTDNSCLSYYTCSGENFLFHQFCPGGTVYNEAVQACDWKANVAPPCGTKH